MGLCKLERSLCCHPPASSHKALIEPTMVQQKTYYRRWCRPSADKCFWWHRGSRVTAVVQLLLPRHWSNKHSSQGQGDRTGRVAMSYTLNAYIVKMWEQDWLPRKTSRWLKACTGLLENPSLVTSPHAGQTLTSSSSISKGSDNVFWPQGHLHTHAHIPRQINTHMHYL